MIEFIYEKKESLSPETCKEIITLFERKTDQQFIGRVGSGKKINRTSINKNVKNTLDINIVKNDKDWEKYVEILSSEINNNLSEYFTKLDPTNTIFHFNKIFGKITYSSYLMHKYFKDEGVFNYHNDFSIDYSEYRILNYLWYLNEVEEGGETEFFGHHIVKPECGKLIFFPSEWFFPHKGNIPRSNDKYVIAGWLYIKI